MKKDGVAGETMQELGKMEVEKPREQQTNEVTGVGAEKSIERPTPKSKFVYSYK